MTDEPGRRQHPGWPDPHVPNVARVYGIWLDGDQALAHTEADRRQAAATAAHTPGMAQGVKDGRAFLKRAVEFIARQGTGQFIDLGAGLPSQVHGNVHDYARAGHPGARVVYVDSDPLVVLRIRTEFAADPGIAAVRALVEDPAALFASPQVEALINRALPAGVILVNTLPFLPPGTAGRVVRELMAWCAPGSYVAIACGGQRDTAGNKRFISTYRAADIWAHAPHVIAGWLDGLELVPPGITDGRAWGAIEGPLPPARFGVLYGVVARKP